MRLVIFFFYCFQGIRSTQGHFCVHQPNILSVNKDGSVTIPCTYTYDEPGDDIQYRVHWGRSDEQNCYNIIEEVIDTAGNIIPEYKGRISRVQDPKKRKESITITGLKGKDGFNICCKVTNIENKMVTWGNNYGSYLQFPGEKSLSQPEKLIAVPGEDVTIPCHYPQEITGEVQRVTWYIVNSEICSYEDEIHRSDKPDSDGWFSIVKFPTDVSLKIHKVPRNGYSHFCCKVTTTDGVLSSRQSTHLVVLDQSSVFTVKQPNNITAETGDSVTLNCSYSHDNNYRDTDVLWVNVYWRVNSTSGPYVYHPYQEMVHPSYRGRTSIEGLAELLIQGVRKADNASYYCLLIVKLCVDSEKSQQVITYGQGTRLIVKETFLEEERLVITISICALVFLVILCVMLIILKAKGIICKKKKNVSDLNMNTGGPRDKGDGICEEIPYFEIGGKKPERGDDGEVYVQSNMANGQDENLLYAKLNKTKLEQRKTTKPPIQEEKVIYSTVLNLNSQHGEHVEFHKMSPME